MEGLGSIETQQGAVESLIRAYDAAGQYRLLILVAAVIVAYLAGRHGPRFVAWAQGVDPDGDEAIKLQKKRLNEHLKLFGSFCNTIGAAIIGAAFIVPYIQNNTPKEPFFAAQWLLVGIFLHFLGHVAVRLIRAEV